MLARMIILRVEISVYSLVDHNFITKKLGTKKFGEKWIQNRFLQDIMWLYFWVYLVGYKTIVLEFEVLFNECNVNVNWTNTHGYICLTTGYSMYKFTKCIRNEYSFVRFNENATVIILQVSVYFFSGELLYKIRFWK